MYFGEVKKNTWKGKSWLATIKIDFEKCQWNLFCKKVIVNMNLFNEKKTCISFEKKNTTRAPFARTDGSILFWTM